MLAIVLGLTLQNTLSDVFSGLAINIERPFKSGDWITVTDHAAGEVIEVNWRATRIKTWTNDMIVIPNSVVTKAIVTNHSHGKDLHIGTVRVKIDHTVSPARVIGTLQAAARCSAGISAGTIPTAYACEFSDALITYEVAFTVDSFALASRVQSEVIMRVTDDCQSMGIKIGTPAINVRLIQHGDDAVANRIDLTPNLVRTEA